MISKEDRDKILEKSREFEYGDTDFIAFGDLENILNSLTAEDVCKTLPKTIGNTHLTAEDEPKISKEDRDKILSYASVLKTKKDFATDLRWEDFVAKVDSLTAEDEPKISKDEGDKPPKKIYLQWFRGDPTASIGNYDAVTWCVDKINDDDVEYARTAEDADNTKTKVLSQREKNQITKRSIDDFWWENYSDIPLDGMMRKFIDWLDRRE